MLEWFKQYFTKLERMSCDELDRSAEKLVQAEKQSTAKLIAHLAEMSRRKAALELGYKHLYDYCLTRLRLSEGSIPLRIQVANAARRYPQLLVALSHNRISLTVAGLVASHVDESNADELVSACEGKSKRDAEEYLVSIRPKPVYEPSIRKQATRAPSLPSAPPSDPTHASPPASSRNSGWERRAHRTVARCGPFISHFLRAPAFVFAGGSIRERRELGNELAADAVELGFELAHEGVAPT